MQVRSRRPPADIARARRVASRCHEQPALRTEATYPTPDLTRQHELAEMRPRSRSSVLRLGPRVPDQCNQPAPIDARPSMVLPRGLPVRGGRVLATEDGMRSVRRYAVAR